MKAGRVPVTEWIPPSEVQYDSAAARIDPLLWRRAYYYDDHEERMSDIEKMFQLLGAGEIDEVLSFPWVESAYLGERIRRGVPEHVRQELLTDAECVVCGVRESLEVDHIYPVSRGGKSDLDNLQVLCKSCNCAKGPRTMEEWRGQA